MTEAPIETVIRLGFTNTAYYQEFHGLVTDGIVGPITQKHLKTPRICSRPDIEHFTAENRQIQKWPFKKLVVQLQRTIAPFDKLETLSILTDALQSWADVTNLDFEIRTSGNRHINITTGQIDGPSGTLAWSELPNSSNHVTQKYDSGEKWVHSSNPPTNKIDLLAVMVHELGHALGLSHAPSSQADHNIMAPFYNPSIRAPLTGDIYRIQALYGPPIETPPPKDNGDDNKPPLATGKLQLTGIQWSKKWGIILDIAELPDNFDSDSD